MEGALSCECAVTSSGPNWGVWALSAPAQAVFGEVGPEAWGSGLGWGGEGKRLVPGFV